MQLNINDGDFSVGVFQQFESVAWKNDPNKFNHRVVISRTYTDRFGNATQNYSFVNIHPDDVTRLSQLERQLNGKRVMVPVVNNLKSDLRREKPYAFLDTYMPKGSQIIELESVTSSSQQKAS